MKTTLSYRARSFYFTRSGAALLVLMVSGVASAQLTMSASVTGNVEGQLFGATDPNFTGNFVVNVTGIPASATILRAFLYANEWNSIQNASATFNGNALASIAAFANDNGAYAYKWDVTGQIIMNGPQTITINGPFQLNGTALAVIYSDPSLLNSTVVINDGILNVGDIGAETVQTSIAGVPAGAAKLSIYTQGDDNVSTGEQVKFNNVVVGGPLDGNLGTHASILNMTLNVTALAGNDVASVDTTNDQYGWQVAMLQAQPIPEPATLLALGLGSLVLMRRRKKSRARGSACTASD